MNRIEDERIKFYLEHEAQIREWADLKAEVCEFLDRFYCSLKDDLDAALKSGEIPDDDVESFLHGGNLPGIGLRRPSWPKSDEGPDVRLEWPRKEAFFPPHGWLVCGVKASAKRYELLFAKEAHPSYPSHDSWWPAYRDVEPLADKFLEGDNLKEYRDHLVETIIKAWKDLAPRVDEAVGHPPS